MSGLLFGPPGSPGSSSVFSRILDLRGDGVTKHPSGSGSRELAGLTVSLQEDQAYDHAERVHVKLQGALPGNASPVQTQPGAGHRHHGEAQQLGESHTVGQPSRAGAGTALHAEAAAAGKTAELRGLPQPPNDTAQAPQGAPLPPPSLLPHTPHSGLMRAHQPLPAPPHPPPIF